MFMLPNIRFRLAYSGDRANKDDFVTCAARIVQDQTTQPIEKKNHFYNGKLNCAVSYCARERERVKKKKKKGKERKTVSEREFRIYFFLNGIQFFSFEKIVVRNVT